MKELFDKRFWRGVVKTFIESREGVDRRPRPDTDAAQVKSLNRSNTVGQQRESHTDQPVRKENN